MHTTTSRRSAFTRLAKRGPGATLLAFCIAFVQQPTAVRQLLLPRLPSQQGRTSMNEHALVVST